MKKLNKKKLALLTACVISSIANIGFAEEAAQEDLDAYVGEDYVVTATKTKLEEKKVPMSVQVLDKEKIQQTGAYNVRDALRFATDLDVQESGMSGNRVMMRGMDTKHVLILIDGRRMAGENTGSTMNVYELSRINLNDVERIEIIRGNSSSIYGSDAMAGVINIITKNSNVPSGSYEVHTGTKSKGTSFSYASGKQGKVSAKFSGGIEDTRTMTSSYDSVTYNGVVTGSNMHGPRRFLNMAFDYEFKEDQGLKLDMNFMREQFTSNSSQPDTIGIYNYDNNRSDYALTFYGKDDKNDYNIRAYYNTLKKFNTSIENNALSDWDRSSYDTFVLEGKNSTKVDDKNTLTYGMEYTTTSMEGTRFGGGGDNKYSDTYGGITKDGSEKEMDTYAAYIQDELQLNDKWLLIPAVRYDHHEAFGSNTSPKIGSTYNLSNNSRVKVNYGKGYRAPTVFELYSQMDKRMGFQNVQVLGNDKLQPEKSTNFDIAFEGEKGKTSAKIGYFQNKIKNLIDNGPYTITTSPSGMTIKSQYENIAEAEIKGVEAELGYNFNDNWSVKATYNYLDAKDKGDNSRLNSRARQNGVVQLSYTDGRELPFSATLWSQWYVDYLYKTSVSTGSLKGTYNNTYTFNTLNFVMNKQITKDLRVYAGVDNIFDKTLPYDDTHSYSIDGRTWRVGAEMTF